MVGIVIMSLLIKHSYAGDWTSSGYDLYRERLNTTELSSYTFGSTPLWQKTLSTNNKVIISTPAVADGYVVIGTQDKKVIAYKEDGTFAWSYSSDDAVCGSPAIKDGRVYVGSLGGRLYCLRLADGNPVWQPALELGGKDYYSSPAIAGTTLFMGLGTFNRKVAGVDIKTGLVSWEKEVNQIVYSSPAVSGNLVIIGTNSGRYYARDFSSGDEIWHFDTTGTVMLSSPLVVGNLVYLLPGGADSKFYRVAINGQVDSDKKNVDSSNWDIPITDPSPPAGYTLIDRAVSSPMFASSVIAFVIRFDWYNSGTGQYTLQEYVVGVDTDSKSVKWQVSNGSLSTTNKNDIPSLKLCPTPAGWDRAGPGTLIAVSSSLQNKLRILDPANNGQELASLVLDAPGRSSPVFANGRLYVATDAGTLYCFQSTYNTAPSAPTSGFTPSGGTDIESSMPTISWNPPSDTENGADKLRYIFRLDTDNEILEDWDVEITTTSGQNSATLTSPLAHNQTYYYAVRAIDDKGACSPWSSIQTFSVHKNPAPPVVYEAMPGDKKVTLYWNISPSPGVVGYILRYETNGSSWGPIQIGNVTTYTVNDLENYADYTFYVYAIDTEGDESSGAVISATPQPLISIDGSDYPTLADAFDAAREGDTIYLGSGTFYLSEPITLHEGISLWGVSPRYTFVDATGLASGIIIQKDADGGETTVGNLTLLGSSVGIKTETGTATLTNIIIRDHTDSGIFIDKGGNFTVINATILDNKYGVKVISGTLSIRNSIVVKNSSTGIAAAAQGATVYSQYNDVYGNSYLNYDNCNAGTGDISQTLQFVDEVKKDYRVKEGQPTIDAGHPEDEWLNEPHPHGGRINMGAYGNTQFAARSESLQITTTTLSDGESNSSYSVKISTKGGSPPVSWTLKSGILPAGLTLASATGEIYGNLPTGSAGTYTFIVNGTDTDGYEVNREFTIVIHQASGNTLHITTTTLSDAEEGSEYSAKVSAGGGFPPYSWQVVSGKLPQDLNLDSTTGDISGILPAGSEGLYTFTVRVTDKDLYTAEKELSIIVNSKLVKGSGGGGGHGGRCFIATAAYGSTFEPTVRLLCKFRDEYLETSETGRWVTSIYYKYSPQMAKYIGKSPVLKLIVQILLIPLVGYSWFIIKMGLFVKIATCLFLSVVCIYLIQRWKRRLSLQKMSTR
jgi:outer membrane protein assembly factor BamB